MTDSEICFTFKSYETTFIDSYKNYVSTVFDYARQHSCALVTKTIAMLGRYFEALLMYCVYTIGIAMQLK